MCKSCNCCCHVFSPECQGASLSLSLSLSSRLRSSARQWPQAAMSSPVSPAHSHSHLSHCDSVTV